MILSCPSCSTRYSVSDTALRGAGRTVRCAACGHSWFATPEHDPLADFEPPQEDPREEAPPPPVRETLPKAYRAKVENRKRQRARAAAMTGWGATAACLIVALGLSVMFRADIVRALPQTASAYAMAGVEANIYGMQIRDFISERTTDNGEPALSVRAELRNIDRKPRAAPAVRFDLTDAEGEAFFGWTVEPEAAALAPGETTTVAAVLVNPPDRAMEVVMTLVDPPESEAEPTEAVAERHDEV